MSKYKDSLETIQTIVKDPAAFRGGVPQWKSSDEIDQYFTRRGFRLTGGEAWGPKGLPDGQQLIYEGPNNVIVKVKTRGYGEGGPERRRGVATMSIEATDGKGTGWDNVLFKVDQQGEIRAKNVNLVFDDEMRKKDPSLKNDIIEIDPTKLKPNDPVRKEYEKLPANHPRKQAKTMYVTRGGTHPDGSPKYNLVSFPTVVPSTANKTPLQLKTYKDNWADATHLNLRQDFDPKGADKIAARLPPKNGPKGGGTPPTLPPRGMVFRSGSNVGRPTNTAKGTINTGSGRGGAVAGGVLNAVVALAIPIIKNYFAQHLAAKWKKEEQDLFLGQLLFHLPAINAEIFARHQEIAREKANGRRAYVRVQSHGEFTPTDMGPALTKIEILGYHVYFEGDTAMDFTYLETKQGFVHRAGKAYVTHQRDTYLFPI